MPQPWPAAAAPRLRRSAAGLAGLARMASAAAESSEAWAVLRVSVGAVALPVALPPGGAVAPRNFTTMSRN